MKRLKWGFVILMSVWWLFTADGLVFATESVPEDFYEEEVSGYDFQGIEQFLNQQEDGWNVSFQSIVSRLFRGDIKGIFTDIGSSIKNILFFELETGSKFMVQIMILGVVAAVFTNFSSVFTSSQISETGFFVTYLLMFTYLSTSFFTSLTIAETLTNQVMSFMQVLLPAYFMAVAFAGGSLTSLASYQFTLLVIAAAQWLLGSVLIPLVRVYVLLIMAGHISKEDILSKLTELIKNVISWSLKTLIGLVLGFHLIQGLVLPYVDATKSTAIRKVIEVIPGIGQGAGAITQIVLGSGVLIKNTIGAAAVVVLIGISLLPMLKLVLMMLLYQLVAAVMQPVCDKRIVSCISETATAHKMLLRIVFTAVMLFVITIAVICTTTNITYYAGG